MLIARPAIIRGGRLATRYDGISRRLIRFLLIGIGVSAFPAVRRGIAGLVAAVGLAIAYPAVGVATCTARPFFAVHRNGFENCRGFL